MTEQQLAAMRQALEALEYYQIAGLATTRVVDSITALRQALSDSVEQPAQQSAERVEPVDWEAIAADQAMTIALLKSEDAAPVQEPVAIHCKAKRENNGVCPNHNLQCGWPKCNEPPVAHVQKLADCCANCLRPEHEHQEGRCPKPFTTVWHAWDYDFPPAQPAPVQEPALFRQFLSDVHTAAGLVTHGKQCKALGARLGEGVMRYMATPPAARRQWVGLTDEEIELLNDCGDTDSYKFARAIEAKLKGKNK